MNILTPNVSSVLPASISAPVGTGVTLSSIAFEVVDKDDVVIQGSRAGTVVNSATGEVTMTLDQATNTLAIDETQAIRQIRMTLTYSDASVYTGTLDYLLRGAAAVIGLNSFVTELEAEMIAFDLHDMGAWNAASVESRRTALFTARDSICRMQFRYGGSLDDQSRMSEFGAGSVSDLSGRTKAELEAFPVDFYAALKKAQLLQANFHLGGDPDEHAVYGGVFSRTVGESSQMFRPGMKPIEMPVCKRALAALHGYTTTRQWHIGRG